MKALTAIIRIDSYCNIAPHHDHMITCLVFLLKYPAHESILALEHPRIMKAGPALFPLKLLSEEAVHFIVINSFSAGSD